uniref:Fibronectin type-III domain-containing protein n=1 Tax=Monopterus albus TaxID=43700 RepID=A0A3Q3K541_MONAL
MLQAETLTVHTKSNRDIFNIQTQKNPTPKLLDQRYIHIKYTTKQIINTITLPAKMTGIPIPTAKWLTDGKEIASEGRYHIESTGSSTTLSIPECQRGDTGEYIVTIGIGAGLESPPTIAKHMFNPPGPPGHPECSDITENAVTLQWTLPDYDGGTPIIGYAIERREMTGKWIRVTKTPVLDLRYRVSGLFEGNTYEFRVFAENSAGISKPSRTSDPIKATRAITKPGPPVNLKLKDWSKSYADICWTKVGQIISLIAKVKGRPDPDITWTKDAKALSRDKRYEINNNYPLCELVINNSVRSDHGKYAIVAKNSSGQAQMCLALLPVPNTLKCLPPASSCPGSLL